ncbi:MAG: hypothetical protein MUD14_02605 [Hydrococcus sp. Prado102]|jgi:hypothetical protein|nr:hypothetical protein [Hydrococcus sp. Prado102]
MDETTARPCDIFLRSPLALPPGQSHHCLLAEHSFIADPGRVQYAENGDVVLYHYTRLEFLDAVLLNGLRARLPVVLSDNIPSLQKHYLVEAFLEPLPQWITNSPYFGSLGLELMRAHVGNILLEITLPLSFPGLYVADAAHNFECKYHNKYGQPALNLGYDCRNGREACQAEVNSYIPLTQYRGGHVAPNAKITRFGEGIAVPPRYITVCDVQPLKS